MPRVPHATRKQGDRLTRAAKEHATLVANIMPSLLDHLSPQMGLALLDSARALADAAHGADSAESLRLSLWRAIWRRSAKLGDARGVKRELEAVVRRVRSTITDPLDLARLLLMVPVNGGLGPKRDQALLRECIDAFGRSGIGRSRDLSLALRMLAGFSTSADERLRLLERAWDACGAHDVEMDEASVELARELAMACATADQPDRAAALWNALDRDSTTPGVRTNILENLARFAYRRNDERAARDLLTRAIPLLDLAVANGEREGPGVAFDRARMCAFLGMLLAHDSPSEARPYLESALAVLEGKGVEEGEAYFQAAVAMSKLHRMNGSPGKARSLLEVVYAAAQERSDFSAETVRSLAFNVGELRFQLGDREGAILALQHRLRLTAAKSDPPSLERAVALIDVASVCASDDPRGLSAVKLALDDLNAIPLGDERNAHWVRACVLLADRVELHVALFMLENAQRVFTDADAEQRGVLMNALAGKLVHGGRIEEALGAADRAIQLAASGSPMNKATSIDTRALVHIAAGRHEQALEDVLAAGVLRTKLLAQALESGSERQIGQAVDGLGFELNLAVSLLLGLPTDRRVHGRGVFELLQRRKGITADTSRLRRELPAERLLDQELTEELRLAREALRDAESRQSPADIAACRQRYDRLEARHLRLAYGTGLAQSLESATLPAISSRLNDDDALWEFVRYDRYDPATLGWAGKRYAAFIVRRNALVGIDLGDADEIDRSVKSFRAMASDGGDRVAQLVPPREANVAPELGALLTPCFRASEAMTRLLFAPDGDLSLASVLAVSVDGQWPLKDVVVQYLTVGRDLLTERKPVSPSAPIVMGAPDYNLEGSVVSTAAAAPVLSFAPLQATRDEVELVARRLGTHAIVGRDATSARILSARSPEVIHLATHGFFLPIQPSDPVDPMQRSGVALAGANRWARGEPLPEDHGDGVLLAADVIKMDLRGTDLVVLSACQTGVGEARSGDGVYGLRRAFFVAGARFLVMSLWSVPDEATRALMDDFYEQLQSSPAPVALHRAQASAMNRGLPLRAWGAFVCQGT